MTIYNYENYYKYYSNLNSDLLCELVFFEEEMSIEKVVDQSLDVVIGKNNF